MGGGWGVGKLEDADVGSQLPSLPHHDGASHPRQCPPELAAKASSAIVF